jgi:hypothetical protein
MILRTSMRPRRIQDIFNFINDLLVRNDIAATILQRDDFEDKHETMENTVRTYSTSPMICL